MWRHHLLKGQPLLGAFPSCEVTQELQVAPCPSVPPSRVLLLPPCPLLPLFAVFFPPSPAWLRLEHLPCSAAPLCSLHLPLQGCSGAGAAGFHGNVSPAPDSHTFIPGMSLHRSTALPSSSGQKPQVKWPPKPPESLKSWCGHPGWGQRHRAGVSMAGDSSLARPHWVSWVVTPHPSSLCLGTGRD